MIPTLEAYVLWKYHLLRPPLSLRRNPAWRRELLSDRGLHLRPSQMPRRMVPHLRADWDLLKNVALLLLRYPVGEIASPSIHSRRTKGTSQRLISTTHNGAEVWIHFKCLHSPISARVLCMSAEPTPGAKRKKLNSLCKNWMERSRAPGSSTCKYAKGSVQKKRLLEHQWSSQ